MLVSDSVANSCDLIHKDHHIGLKHLGGIGEITNIAKTKNSHYLLTRNHDINYSGILNHPANDFSSRLTEPHSQKRPDFNDCIL